MNNSIKLLIDDFKLKGVNLFLDNGKLKFKAFKSNMTKNHLEVLKENKELIIDYLKNSNDEIIVTSDKKSRLKPFPMTDVQSAYALGRNKTLDYGGVACHVYFEIEYEDLEINKVNEVWNKLIKRHDMLRALMTEDGYQKVIDEVPEFNAKFYDLRGKLNYEEILELIREEMRYRMYELGRFPMFDIALSKLNYKNILHFSMEFLIADWKSIWVVLSEFETMYFNLPKDLPHSDITFRDYLIAERKLKENYKYSEDKKYWMDKIDDFYSAPNLPKVNLSCKDNESVRFKRYYLELSVEQWERFKKNANKCGVTPTSAVLAAYAQVLERWSQNKDICINLTVLNRLPIHEDVNNIVGDFTSTSLLNIDKTTDEGFLEKVKKINTRLFEDLDHRLYSGIEVIREISRRKGKEAAIMPIVFTSAIGLIDFNNNLIGKFNNSVGLSQTPQVFIDCQVMDGDFGMQLNWDVREGIFPDKMIEDMFLAFERLLIKLTETFTLRNDYYNSMLPSWQAEIMKKVNNTDIRLDEGMLYSKFLNMAEKYPEKKAVVDEQSYYTYRELAQISYKLAYEIEKLGGKVKDNIAVVMNKGIYQTAAVLGILYTGAAYVPIDAINAKMRRNKIIRNAGIKIVLTTSDLKIEFEEGVQRINVDKLKGISEPFYPKIHDDTIPAYIIYTSGTTGEPKGVVINHKAAVNTIEDINKKFNINENDSILGLSQLHFDLSVYDIFGTLSTGGTIVYTKTERYMDPSYWVELVKEYNITIWNSVPAFLKMLINYLEDIKGNLPLRLVMLSGDWIPLDMPNNLLKICKNAKIVSLGGATEAAIWSIYHEYEGIRSECASIPYGLPLANQGFKILDDDMYDCPVWVPGEICIYGRGLAIEYYNDEEMTGEKFITHNKDNIRIYKTGDIGRYLPDGQIELLGRIDQQIKLRGHRIELGEIESVINTHPDISQSVAFLNKNKTEIYAVVEFNKGVRETTINELKEFISSYLPSYMIPRAFLFVDSIPLTNNGKIDRKLISKMNIGMEVEECRITNNKIQTIVEDLIKIWNDVTKTEGIKANDNFYELGADSLLLAQIATKIRAVITSKIAFDDLLREMMYNSTIIHLAEFVNKKINSNNEVLKDIEEIKKKEIIFVQDYGGNEEDGLRVIFHGSLGALNRFDNLGNGLLRNGKGKVIAIGISDIDVFCSIDSKKLINLIANECVKIISKYRTNKIQPIGYCFGGLISIETANCLNELGYEVSDLNILDSLLLATEFRVEDELLMEMMFLDTMSLSVFDIGFEKQKVYEKILLTESMNKNTIPSGFLKDLKGDEDTEDLGMFFKKLSLKNTTERFKIYVNALENKTGNKTSVELMHRLYNVCKKSFEVMHYNLYPNFGNMNYFLAKDTETAFKRLELENFKNICLGKFKVYEIPGDHYSCVEDAFYGLELANLINSIS